MKYTARIVKFICIVLAYLESIFTVQHAPQQLCLCCCTGEASDPDVTSSLHTSVLLDLIDCLLRRSHPWRNATSTVLYRRTPGDERHPYANACLNKLATDPKPVDKMDERLHGKGGQGEVLVSKHRHLAWVWHALAWPNKLGTDPMAIDGTCGRRRGKQEKEEDLVSKNQVQSERAQDERAGAGRDDRTHPYRETEFSGANRDR